MRARGGKGEDGGGPVGWWRGGGEQGQEVGRRCFVYYRWRQPAAVVREPLPGRTPHSDGTVTTVAPARLAPALPPGWVLRLSPTSCGPVASASEPSAFTACALPSFPLPGSKPHLTSPPHHPSPTRAHPSPLSCRSLQRRRLPAGAAQGGAHSGRGHSSGCGGGRCGGCGCGQGERPAAEGLPRRVQARPPAPLAWAAQCGWLPQGSTARPLFAASRHLPVQRRDAAEQSPRRISSIHACVHRPCRHRPPPPSPLPRPPGSPCTVVRSRCACRPRPRMRLS